MAILDDTIAASQAVQAMQERSVPCVTSSCSAASAGTRAAATLLILVEEVVTEQPAQVWRAGEGRARVSCR